MAYANWRIDFAFLTDKLENETVGQRRLFSTPSGIRD